MAARVISFRVDDEMINELEQRKLQDESIMLTAQRVLREALGLGVIGEQSRRVEEIVDSAVLPLQSQVEELRARLELFEESRNNSEMEKRLNNLSDELPRLVQDIWTLKEAMQGSGEPLLERVEKLEALIYELRRDMEELKKSKVISEDNLTTPIDSQKLKIEDDSTTPDDSPQFKCPHCNAVGIIGQNFKPSGSDEGKKRHLCKSCMKKTFNLVEVK